MDRIPKPAMALFYYLRAIGKLYGWIKIKVSTLMKKYKRSEATINRWLGSLRAAGKIRSEQRGRCCCVYTILIGESDRPEAQRSLYEPTEEELPTEVQNHRDDVEPVETEPIRKAAGFERLSEGDRRYVHELQRAGVDAAAIRAGVLVGRARRAVADSKRVSEPIRSLRYFAGPISEATRGVFEPGYIDHVAGWIERKMA